MRTTVRHLCFSIAAATLLAACSDRPTVSTAPYPADQSPQAVMPPNPSPYAQDPMDPQMNPHNVINSHHR